MTAYLIAQVKVRDWERYRDYVEATPAIVERYGGRFLARGGEHLTLEGTEDADRVVLIEFPSLEQAKAFYQSPDYTKARGLRQEAAEASLIAVDGVD